MNTTTIKNLLNKYNIDISDEKCQKLADFHDILLEFNKIHNLTTITEESDVLIKHYLDSIMPINILKNNKKKVIDIGCGAGFPSIPLAILNENLEITAIDSVNKKVKFVNFAIEKLQLKNITALHTRIEDLANNKLYREKFDYVLSRAVASMPTIIEYSAPFLKVNGQILSYKGTNYNEELEISANALTKLHCKVSDIHEYFIEELNTNRYVVAITKLKSTPPEYPRNQNKPRSSPL